MEDKYELYDKIVSATYTNILIETNMKEYLVVEYGNTYADKVFYEAVKAIAYITNRQIMIKCNIFRYVLLKIKEKNNKQILRFREGAGNPIPVQALAEFEATEFGVDFSIFEEIYNAYYAKKGKI